MRIFAISLSIIALFSSCIENNNDTNNALPTDFCSLHASVGKKVCTAYQCLKIDCNDNNGKLEYTMTLNSKLVGEYFRPEFVASMVGLGIINQGIESNNEFDSLRVNIKVEDQIYPYNYGYNHLAFVHSAQLTAATFATNLIAKDFQKATDLMDKDLALAEGEQVLLDFVKALNANGNLTSYELAGFQSLDDVVVIYLVLVDDEQEFVTCKFNFRLSSSKSIIGIGFL